MPTAGKYRHRITIEQPTESQSTSGAVSSGWSTFATRWAEMIALDGTERFESAREHAEVDHAFTVRHLDGVTPKMRISYDGRTFDIESAFDVEGRKRELVILTREEV